MVETVSLAGMGSSVSASRAATTSSASSDTSAFSVSVSSNAQGVQQISPTMHTDPMSGVLVTEYLSANGDIQMQLPSAAALAYLRSGLTATGLPKEKVAETTLATTQSAQTQNAALEQSNVLA